MRSVWAVARNTIAQALRMKVAAVIILLLLILLPLMSGIMEGDGTLKGKLQTFVSYSLSLTSFLLCLLTIAISTYSLTHDVKYKQIHLVVTKPIHRFQILLGKLLGVVMLNVFLLVVFAVIIYGLTVAMPGMGEIDEGQLAEAQREFFTARIGLKVDVDEEKIEKQAIKQYKKLEARNELPETMSRGQILSELRGRERMKERAVEVGHEKVWRFENVKLQDDTETLFIRYKYQVSVEPPDSKVYGTWLVGDYRQVEYGLGDFKTRIYPVARAEVTQTFHEFEIPADAVAEDGYLAVVFRNDFLNRTTVIPEEVEVLYRADSFTSNYIRVILLLLVRLIFLAVLGVSVSTWLSFPVAILICLAVFFIGTINGFIAGSFDYLSSGFGLLYSFTIKPLFWLLPRFDGEFNPTRFMISAKLVTWLWLARVYSITVFAKGALLLLFGMFVFSNREIAKTFV